jgi:hypothetical protein
MRKQNLFIIAILLTCTLLYSSCKKDSSQDELLSMADNIEAQATPSAIGTSAYNLEVVLQGDGNNNGHIHFRQNTNETKIIRLDTKIHHLLPNHEYLLQRAVDTNLDGECTGTNWLTLGYGLTSHDIVTNENGDGQDELWRDVSMIASGSTFDIHFRILDKATSQIVLTSGCHQYTVR